LAGVILVDDAAVHEPATPSKEEVTAFGFVPLALASRVGLAGFPVREPAALSKDEGTAFGRSCLPLLGAAGSRDCQLMKYHSRRRQFLACNVV